MENEFINTIGELIVLLGTLFILLAAIGTARMPDFLMKLQVPSKASAFGIFLILLGGNIVVQTIYFAGISFIIFIFLLITTPIGAHALANAKKKMD